jgi:hypothetical protein
MYDDISIPEEYIIIGAALKIVNNRVSIDKTVSKERIKEYLKTFKLPITYDEVRDFKFCKETDSGWEITSQPPLTPDLVQLLIRGSVFK